jgi:hypothetical protein
MDDSDRAILKEIRDLQREHLEEYKRAAERSISLQEKAMARQEQIAKLYRRVVFATALFVIGAIAYIRPWHACIA